MKFKRSMKGALRVCTKDSTGSIRVSVIFAKRRSTGNIVRGFTVANSKVSIVARAIEIALFGKAS